MTATTTKQPKTAAEARKLLSELQAKRAGLTRTIEASAEKRKGHAVAAEFGDAAAAETLRTAAAEETQARDALVNIDIVIAGMSGLRDELQEGESSAREMQAEQELSDATDEMLRVADAIDDKADELRALLFQYDELKVHPVLRRARRTGSLPGALVPETKCVGRSLLAYFDEWLPNSAGASYAEITRVAEWAARNSDRESPRMQERPPRELSTIEKNMRRSTMSATNFAGGSGFDSTIEAEKHHAKKAGASVVDVSAGWPANG